MYAKKPKLAGTIKVKEENAYGYFGMDIREVKENFKESLDKINQNLGLKGISAVSSTITVRILILIFFICF